MESKRLLLSLSIVSLAVLGAFILPIGPARGDGQAVGDQWAPVGPFVREIMIKHFGTTASEFGALNAKEIDLTDWRLTLSLIASLTASADHVVSPLNKEFGMFDVQFNYENTFWGIPFNFANNAAGDNIRQAFAHLIDKKAHIATNLGGLGILIDNHVNSEAVGAPLTPTPDSKLYDPMSHGAPQLSAYNLADDADPKPAQCSADWRAAKEHLLAAGFTASGTAAACGDLLLNAPSGTVGIFIRSDDPARNVLGTNMVDAWNSLFAGGAGGLSATFGDINQAFPVIFTAEPAALDWHIYTGGFRLGSRWLHFFGLFHSFFASDDCGGRKSRLPDNYWFSCRADLDTELGGGFPNPATAGGLFFSTDVATSAGFARNAMQIIGAHAIGIPVWAGANQYGFLKGWRGMIDTAGNGPPSIQTLLNARCSSPGATTCAAGLDSASGRLRWGFRQGTTRLNVFSFGTLWEAFINDEIYESLLGANPYAPNQLVGALANKWQVFLDGVGLGYSPPTGTRTTIRFQLRPNIFFHDGTKMTSSDVKFSLLNFRDVPSDTFLSSVINVIDATILSSTLVDVHLNAKSAFFEATIGGVYMINKKVWDLNNDGAVDTGLDTADVVLNGILAKDGNGPFRFVSTTGGDQAIEIGSQTILGAYRSLAESVAATQYFRATGIFRNFDWTDINDGAGLKVDIIDVASVALCVGKAAPAGSSCSYWDTANGGVGGAGKTPLNGQTAGVVDIIEFSAVASNFGQQWLFPQTWSISNYASIEPYPFVAPQPIN